MFSSKKYRHANGFSLKNAICWIELFYFYDEIASFPFGHQLLEEVRKEKKDLKKKAFIKSPMKKNLAVKN